MVGVCVAVNTVEAMAVAGCDVFVLVFDLVNDY